MLGGEMVDGYPQNPGPVDPEQAFGSLPRLTPDPSHELRVTPEDVASVPLPFVYGRVQTMGQWITSLETEGPTTELVNTMTASIETAERQYPDASVWDKHRRILAQIAFNRSCVGVAMNLVYTIRSAHRMAEAVANLSMQFITHGEDGGALAAAFTERLREDNNGSRYYGFIRAMADRRIDDNPEAPEIAVLEAILDDAEPDFDPVQSWADSQRELEPRADWDSVVKYIKNDDHWNDVPINFRRYAMKLFQKMVKDLKRQSSTEEVENCLKNIGSCEQRYPEAKAWDSFRTHLSLLMIKQRQPTLAREFGYAVLDSEEQSGLVTDLFRKGWKNDAYALALKIRDPNLRAAMLLGNIRKDRGTAQLLQHWNDD